MSDGVLVVDAQGRVVDINRACELILDCRGSEVIGLPVMKILPFWQKQADRKNQFNRRSVEYEPAVTEHEQLDGRHYEMRVTPFSYNRQFTDFQLIILHDITERISLLKELEQMARIDDLTGLYNRRYFLELARVEYEKVLRYGRMLSILMFDIDQFKQVNDTHGHTAGDQVLFEVSQYLSGRLRSCDLLARYGGEEFIILMPETSQQQALEAAERLRADVEDLTIQTDAGAISVTISIGAAGVAPDMSIALEKLLVQADAALYRAKEAGRNCARI
jgi:diguanylate cyclase (GGDEF)-like protein/PAS domain S-box-containing protein